MLLLLDRAGILAGTVSPGTNFRAERTTWCLGNKHRGAWLEADGLHGGDLGGLGSWSGVFLGNSSNNNNINNNKVCRGWYSWELENEALLTGSKKSFQGHLWASLETEEEPE